MVSLNNKLLLTLHLISPSAPACSADRSRKSNDIFEPVILRRTLSKPSSVSHENTKILRRWVSLTNKLLLTLPLILVPFLLAAQQSLDFSYQLSGDKIEITYALGGQPSDRYEVRLFSSFDGYKIPLKLVDGEIGKNIIPGEDKLVIWDAKTELSEYEGNLSLKLKARLIPFMIFSINKGATFKRGKAYMVHWAAGSDAQQVKLELYQDHQKIADVAIAELGNSYNWQLPKNIKPGKSYKIKGSDEECFSFSELFTIKRKVPLIVWAVPAVVVGGVVAVLINRGNQPEPIPLPVKPN